MSLNNFRNREERARFDREEAQEQEAKLAPAKAELSRTLQKATRYAAMYWKQDLKHLAKLVTSGMYESDYGIEFPQAEGPRDYAREQEAFNQFIADLPKSGWALSQSGVARLLLYATAQANGENRADLSQTRTWRRCFNRLSSDLGAFREDAGEIGYDENMRQVPAQTEQPARKLTVNDLEGIDTTTKVGQRLAHQILADEVFGEQGEGREVFQGFVDHVSKTFHYSLDESQQRELISWFQKNNKSFLDHRSYDTAKMFMVRRGILPRSVCTPDELFSLTLEEKPTQSWEDRRNIATALAALRQQ